MRSAVLTLLGVSAAVLFCYGVRSLVAEPPVRLTTPLAVPHPDCCLIPANRGL